MKNALYLFVLLSSSFIIGCSDDDTADPHPCATYLPPPHAGTWNLVNVSGSFAGVNHDFEPGVIKWDFKFCPGHTVTVVNNNDDEQVEDFMETGTYALTISETDGDASECQAHWIIDNTNFGCKEFSDDGESHTLTLTQPFPDGYTLTFKR